MKTYPTATQGLGCTRFAFPFNGAMVEEIKAVPVAYRNYDPATRIWTVSAPYADRVLDRFLRRFPGADVIDDRGARSSAPPPPPKAPATPHATLYVLPSAPREVIEASYKALVKKYHPDRLPEPERAHGNAVLARINVAYAQLTGGR
ncbi:MAG TPA: hypothetical protein VIL85_23320 [Thermomicrobiales bacterium]|jgi:hypothetical protein